MHTRFPREVKRESAAREVVFFWKEEVEMRATHKEVCVPNDFPFREGDAVTKINAGFETIGSYLWIRREQTLREVAEQRGYVLPEFWDDQA